MLHFVFISGLGFYPAPCTTTDNGGGCAAENSEEGGA